jgi:hypothetical protein
MAIGVFTRVQGPAGYEQVNLAKTWFMYLQWLCKSELITKLDIIAIPSSVAATGSQQLSDLISSSYTRI